MLVAILLGCFAGAAGLSIAEVSILRVRRSEVLVRAQEGDARSKRLLALLDDLPVVLNSVLLLVLLLQVVAATVGGVLAGRWFGGIGVSVATVVLTMVLFVYAEAIPKTMAVRSPQRMALRMTPLLTMLVPILKPPVRILVALADLQSPGKGATLGALTEDEIRALARESADAGKIAPDDATLVERSFEFNDRRVAEIMVPRDQIAAVSADDDVVDAMTRAIALGHRRLPVCLKDAGQSARGDTDIDRIVGVVRLRDLAASARTFPTATAESLMGEVVRCSPDHLVSDLLSDMQESGQWLAIVEQSDGTTLGLATIEDVVAELVGEITAT